MNFEVAIELPIPVSDLFEIQKVLKSSSIICSCFNLSSFNVYSIDDYIREKEINGTKISALFDRNIFTDIISLMRSKKVSPSSESIRLAAALMAFLQCSDVFIEPNIALYEYASTNGSFTANEELRLFRIADNIHPKIYADIALKRKFILKRKSGINSQVEALYNFENQLRFWNFNYTIVLKLALIELEAIEQHQKMAKFMKWMFEEFYFGAPATLFANCYFANKAKMKGIKSFDRKRALASLKNMTWDLTLLTEWAKKVERQKETNTIWLLCSRDKMLMRIGHCLMYRHVENALEEKAKNIFIENWGNRIGAGLYGTYLQYKQTCNDKSRVANKRFSSQYFEEMRLKFGRELLEKKVKI